MNPADLQSGHVYAARVGDARYRFGPSQVLRALPAVQFARMCCRDVTVPPATNLARS